MQLSPKKASEISLYVRESSPLKQQKSNLNCLESLFGVADGSRGGDFSFSGLFNVKMGRQIV
jgi:hypothetical protein